jgi:uncharacterized protein YecT (DUF1311 family)
MSIFKVPHKNLNPSYGELLGDLRDVKTKEQADQFRADYIAWLENRLKVCPEQPLPKGVTSLEQVNKNIAYYSGYFGFDEQNRLCNLFDVGY